MDSFVPLFPARNTSAKGPSTSSTPLLIRAPLSYEEDTDGDGGSVGATDSDIESFVSGEEGEFESLSERNVYVGGFNNESVSMAFAPKARISVDDEDDGGSSSSSEDFSATVMVPSVGEAEGLEDAKDGFDDTFKFANEGTDVDDDGGLDEKTADEDEGFDQVSPCPFETDENSDTESRDLTDEQNFEVGSSNELMNHQIDEATVDEDGNLNMASGFVDSGMAQEPKLDGLANTDGFEGSIMLKLENESKQTLVGVGDEPVGIGTNSTAVLEGWISSDMETQSLDFINDGCNDFRNVREVKLQRHHISQDSDDDEGKRTDLIEGDEKEREATVFEIDSDSKKKDDTVCEETHLKLDHEKGSLLVDPVKTSARQENSTEEDAHDEQKLMDFSESAAYGNSEEPLPECHYVKNVFTIADAEPPAKLGDPDEKRPNETMLTSTISGESSDEEKNSELVQTSIQLEINSKEVLSNSYSVANGLRSTADAELPRSFCNDCDIREVTSETSEKINDGEEEESMSSIILEEFAFDKLMMDHPDGLIVPNTDEEIVIDETDEVDKLPDPASLEARCSNCPAEGPSTQSTSVSGRTMIEHDNNNMNEDDRRFQEKIDKICLKFLHIVHRLGYSSEENVAAHVLRRLDLIGGTKHVKGRGHFFSQKCVRKMELQMEKNQEFLEFSCNILVIGKTGVGKSAVINSIFCDQMTHTCAFQPATPTVKVVSGVADGISIRIMDTPGLSPSLMDYGSNRKILLSIRKHMKKFSPDCVLYVDRLDTLWGNNNDSPLFRSITDVLGLSIWNNVVIALTHAGSPPPDGSDGTPLHYDIFVQKRYNVIRDFIMKEVGCKRPIPVALVENHPSCKTNSEKVLPNGLCWRQRLLLLCYSSKTIAEVELLQEVKTSSQRKIFGLNVRFPPLLSSLFRSRPDPHLTADRSIQNSDSYHDLIESITCESEEDDDRLDCFKSPRKLQISKLSKEQQDACFEGCDCQVMWKYGNVGFDDYQDETTLTTGPRKTENHEANLCTHFSETVLDKGYPVGYDTSNLGICLLSWRKDSIVPSNLQFQFSVGRNSKMGLHLVVNNKQTGQVTVKTTTSSYNLQVSLLGLLPMFISIYRSICPGELMGDRPRFLTFND